MWYAPLAYDTMNVMLIIERTAQFIKWQENIKDKKVLSILDYRISRIRRGIFGDYKWIAKGVYELRLHVHGGIRIYYTRRGSEVILLLVGGNKSTQKRDIEKAVRLLKEL
jgi:putative addiction module killer protein